MAELKIAVRIDSMGLPLRQALETASRLGATAVELNAKNGINPSSLSDTGLRSFRKMLDDLNLRVASLRFPTRRGYDHVPDLDRRVDATKQLMLLAYRLGAPVVINSLGQVPQSADDPRYQTLEAVVDDLGRHGAKVGSFFAAETGTESGEQLMNLLESSEDGYVAVALNPGQLIINQFELRPSVAAVSARVQIGFGNRWRVGLVGGARCFRSDRSGHRRVSRTTWCVGRKTVSRLFHRRTPRIVSGRTESGNRVSKEFVEFEWKRFWCENLKV